jgi:hypothetical protein
MLRSAGRRVNDTVGLPRLYPWASGVSVDHLGAKAAWLTRARQPAGDRLAQARDASSGYASDSSPKRIARSISRVNSGSTALPPVPSRT